MESISGVRKLEVVDGVVVLDDENKYVLSNLVAVDIDPKEMESFTVTFKVR